MKKLLACVLGVAFLALGCTEQAGAAQTKQISPAVIAEQIAAGVGSVQASASGRRGVVFVFEEFHTSRVGRLETGVMLARLHDRQGLKLIGLEGAIQSAKPLDAGWFHRTGDNRSRDVVAVRMLAEGEINSGEFMALAFNDTAVHGTEIASEYERELKAKGNPAISYLLKIAEKGLSQTQIRNINALLTQKKKDEAFDAIMKSDPWVQEQYGAIRGESATPAEASLEHMRAIKAKAASLGITIDATDSAGMDDVIGFYQTTSKRSDTMVARIDELSAQSAGPMAMIIGAAHTDRVAKTLGERGFAYAVLRPNALNPKYGQLTVEQFELKNKKRWAHRNLGTLGRLLNVQRNPPPIIETATAKSYASANFAALIIAQAARKAKKVPEDIREQLTGLPECRVDLASFTVDGYDVIYRLFLKKTDGSETEVWARVGSANSSEDAKTIEQRLFQAIADMGGNSALPPTKPPTNSAAASEEGPGDGKRNNVTISRTSLDTLAVYGANKANVVEVGKISG